MQGFLVHFGDLGWVSGYGADRLSMNPAILKQSGQQAGLPWPPCFLSAHVRVSVLVWPLTASLNCVQPSGIPAPHSKLSFLLTIRLLERILGKMGATINEIQEASNTDIKMNQDRDTLHCMLFLSSLSERSV